MLKQLISTDGAGSISDLLAILRAEIASGVPAPVPDWYSFSLRGSGTRKIGFYTTQGYDVGTDIKRTGK